MYRFLADFIVARRHYILALIGALFVACLTTVPQLQFDFTPQQLFESSDDAHEYREIFAERFGREDNVVTILVEGDNLFDPEVLGPIRDLTYQLRRHDDIDDAHSVATLALPRPDSLSAEPHLGAPRGVSDGDLVAGPEVDEQQARQLADYAAEEPLIAGRLIEPTGSTALIVAWIDPDLQAVTDLEEITDDIGATIDAYEFPDGVELSAEGIPALRVTIVDQLRTEQIIFVPITAAIFLLVLLFLFRRPSGVVLPLGTVIIALAATVAMLVVTGSSINIINNVLPTLIFVIGISDSIHMVTRHAEEIELGKSHQEAIKAMIRHTGVACLLTTSTTAVGFLSLLSADTAILRSFGWQAALGVMFAYLATLFFLSSSLTYMRPAWRGGRRADESSTPPLLERTLMAIGDRLLARPWTTITVGLLLAGTVAIHGKDVDIDSYILEVLSDDHPTYVATETIEDELGGILPLEMSFEAEDRDTFRRPEVYRAVHQLQEYIGEQENVLSTESYIDFLQTARVAIIGDYDQREVMPQGADEIEQLLLLIADAPDAEDDLYNFVTSDFRNARILSRVQDSGANSHLDLAEDLDDKIEELFGDDDNITVHITGDAYVASAALDSFVRDLMMSLAIAIVIIFLLMTVVFRSIKIGIISLLPNCLPLLVTFGYMGWAGINLNSTTIIIFAISLGIAVDDSIHFFARFVEEKRRQETLKEAILQTYYGAGRAILLTSILLLIGMAVITMSDFVPTQQFGLLTGITIASAILADLFILPALLYLVYSRFPGQTAPIPLRSPTVDAETDGSADKSSEDEANADNRDSSDSK